MEDFILLVLQFLLEFALETFSFEPFELLRSRRRGDSEPPSLPLSCFRWAGAGVLLSILSLVLVHRTFIRMPALQVLNLVLAPIASAFLAEAFAKRRARRHPGIVPRNRFWQAFWFTLGLVAMRFAALWTG